MEKKFIPYTTNDTEIGEAILKKSPSMVSLFNSMKRGNSCIPNQCHYVLSSLNALIDHAMENSYTITEEIRIYLYNRLKKAYMGFIVEEYVIRLTLENFENVLILTNETSDLNEGVDFLLVDLKTEIVYRVHVTSKYTGYDKLAEKEMRGYDRDFTFDVHILYNPSFADETSYLVGDFPFPELSFIEESINAWRSNYNEWHPYEEVGYKLDDPILKSRCTRHGGSWEIYRAHKIESWYEPIIDRVKMLLNN